MVSELVADAVLVDEGDGADPVELAASADGDLVRIEVTAVAAAFEGLARGPKPADRGWGIYLLERLGYSWEVERADESARVRAEKQLAGG